MANVQQPAGMIVVTISGIGGHGKSETISAIDLGQRLVIEWTAQLPPTRREVAAR
jgi:hypothetical protein